MRRWLIIAGLGLAVLGVLAVLGYRAISEGLPEEEALARFAPDLPSTVRDVNGEIVASFMRERGYEVALFDAMLAESEAEFAAAEWVAAAINMFNRISILSEHRVRPRDSEGKLS